MTHRWRVVLLVVVTGLLARATAASVALPLSFDMLADHADAIVTGRVVATASGYDVELDGIYTFVTVEPFEVLKGDLGVLGPGGLVVKQQGGRAGNRGVFVAGQPAFSAGEEVLLFLRARERDGSLFTVGLWQGKWSIEVNASLGVVSAVNVEPQSRTVVNRRAMSDVRRDVQRLTQSTTGRRGAALISAPQPARVRQLAPFVLNDPPIRWSSSPAVNVELRTQAGLAGGGLSEIAAAAAQWNAVGSSLSLRNGTRLPLRCLSSDGTNILVTFNDPCNEISSDPSVLAVASFGYDTGAAQTVNGRLFYPITDAVITTSAHPAAQPSLRFSPCFQSTLAHELGHAIGLDHSPDPNALMYFEVGECERGPLPVGADDVAGLLTIYPASATLPPSNNSAPGQPQVTSATPVGGVLNVAWTMSSGATATSYRLDFFAGGVPVAVVSAGPATSISIPIPAGTVGAFAVQVTAFNGAAAGPASNLFPFTIGTSSGGGCNGPPAAPVVTGAVISGTATVSWSPVAGATSYIVSAGTNPGAANIAAAFNAGPSTTVSASGLPPGFTAWVRVIAVNACGQSAPADFLLSSGGAQPPASSASIQFFTASNACACWTNSIVLEIDGRTVGGTSCAGTAGPFPVTPGRHSYRACDSLGCLSRDIDVAPDASFSVTLSCR